MPFSSYVACFGPPPGPPPAPLASICFGASAWRPVASRPAAPLICISPLSPSVIVPLRDSTLVVDETGNVSVSPTNGLPASLAFVTRIVIEPFVAPTAAV